MLLWFYFDNPPLLVHMRGECLSHVLVSQQTGKFVLGARGKLVRTSAVMRLLDLGEPSKRTFDNINFHFRYRSSAA